MQNIKEPEKKMPQNAVVESTPTLRPGLKLISRKWIDALFARFSRIWPRAWSDTIATHDVDAIAHEWQMGLSEMTGEQIGKAIEHCRKNNLWPPTIAEFIAAGKESAQNAAMYRRNEEALALPKRLWQESREIGQKHLAKLKKVLT